jgi:Rod binding domain-containing protein
MELIAPDTSIALMRAAEQKMQQASQLAEKSGEIKNLKQIEETAKEFEAVFISEMLKPMFEGIKPNPVFGGGKGEEVFTGMMLQEYGKNIAENHSIGIADFVKAEMIRIQEEANQ